MRLTDADVLLTAMKRRKEFIGRASDPVCLVEDAPTIEAVPVVRCKDCKWHDTERCPAVCADYYYSWEPAPDWFCANGERRAEGEH